MLAMRVDVFTLARMYAFALLSSAVKSQKKIGISSGISTELKPGFEMDNGLGIRLNELGYSGKLTFITLSLARVYNTDSKPGFKVFKPQVVVMGAFESLSFARRRGRMGFVIWGLAGCCCMRHSSSLVSCSSSWRSAIGLLLYSSVMKRCHIEYSISSSCHLLRLEIDVVLPRV